ETIYAATLHQILFDPAQHHIRHLWIANKLVTVITVFIVLMQVNIIQTGAPVKHAVINNEAFIVEYAKRFTGINRYAVNRYLDARVFLGHTTVPVGIRIGCRRADASTLSAVPVNQYANVQFRTLPLGI